MSGMSRMCMIVLIALSVSKLSVEVENGSNFHYLHTLPYQRNSLFEGKQRIIKSFHNKKNIGSFGYTSEKNHLNHFFVRINDHKQCGLLVKVGLHNVFNIIKGLIIVIEC